MLHVILVTAYEDLQRHYMADAGVDITTIKRHAGWKSTTVAEGYVENSIENKTKISNQVLVGTTTSAITKTVNVSESNIQLHSCKGDTQWDDSFNWHSILTAVDIPVRGEFTRVQTTIH
ncbi:hypothetical protein NQ317_012209 [Molorchus minor]|uniref:Uncharacterized protein n=1 Tax=Molorchus minor TaxID=1323400 RepID=A0ABQ9JDJ9_9CUCU|nr:hypothetical protein NQ317_012209 [Molorchus minor]